MKTTAVRLYGANDLRIETFELPEITDDEILMRVVTDSQCASTYKAVKQGTAHKRVPPDIAEHPVIIGHEMCGEIVKVGKNVTGWKEGQHAVIQPALKLESGYDPGYSYRYIGGCSTYVVVPKIVLDRGCLVHYEGDGFFEGSLVESLGCVLRGYKGLYHTDYETYTRYDGAKKGGKIAILGGAGPMGIGTAELAPGYGNASLAVVTDVNLRREKMLARSCGKTRHKACVRQHLRYVRSRSGAYKDVGRRLRRRVRNGAYSRAVHDGRAHLSRGRLHQLLRGSCRASHRRRD